VAEEQGNPVIHVSLRSDLVRLLKERQGRKVMENVSPTTFIATELKAVGATGVLQASAKRTTVSRDVKEKGETEGMDPAAADNEMSSWSTFRRFAQETGYLLFEDSGVLYFGQPQWLVQRDSRPLTVAYGDSAFRNASSPKTMPYEVPACSTSIDSKITEVTVKIEPKWFSQVRVGQALTLRGVPGFAATYLITAVKYDMIGTSVIEVTAQTPINQVPEKGPFADGGRLV
jgi:hypothetical protein